MQGGVNSWSVPSHAEEIFEWSEGPAGRGQWCATARVGAPTPPPPRGLWPISVSPLPHNNQTLSATLCFSVRKTLEYKSFSEMKHLHYWKSGNIIIQKYCLKVVRSELSEDQTGWKQTNTPEILLMIPDCTEKLCQHIYSQYRELKLKQEVSLWTVDDVYNRQFG